MFVSYHCILISLPRELQLYRLSDFTLTIVGQAVDSLDHGNSSSLHLFRLESLSTNFHQSSKWGCTSATRNSINTSIFPTLLFLSEHCLQCFPDTSLWLLTHTPWLGLVPTSFLSSVIPSWWALSLEQTVMSLILQPYLACWVTHHSCANSSGYCSLFVATGRGAVLCVLCVQQHRMQEAFFYIQEREGCEEVEGSAKACCFSLKNNQLNYPFSPELLLRRERKDETMMIFQLTVNDILLWEVFGLVLNLKSWV